MTPSHRKSLLRALLCSACLIAAILLAGIAASQAMADEPTLALEATSYGAIREHAPRCAEDAPCWNWTTMGNHRRGVVTMWGTMLVVSPHRFCLLAKHGNLSPDLSKLRGDFTAKRTAC